MTWRSILLLTAVALMVASGLAILGYDNGNPTALALFGVAAYFGSQLP